MISVEILCTSVLFMSDMGDDLIRACFSFLNGKMLARVGQMNKRFCSIASEDVLWYEVLRKDLGESLPRFVRCPNVNHLWRRRFRQWKYLDNCSCNYSLYS